MDMQRGFRLGAWNVSPLTGEIESAGETVHLEPKVMEVLVVLAEHAGDLVLRDALLDRVWGARAATSDEPLTRCIAQLRQALGDSPRNPKFIQTVPKRGYRLIVPVTPVGDAAGPTAPVEAVSERRSGPKTGIALIGTLAVLGLIAWFTLPVVQEPEPGLSASLDRCRLELIEAPFTAIDLEAIDECEEGLEELDQRESQSLLRASLHFRNAFERDPNYGSAIVNLARAMVLLPSYEDDPDPYYCRYDDNEALPSDCFEGAIRLLERYGYLGAYVDRYSHGIRGYANVKQHRFIEALGAFRNAETYTPTDADMWQWRSQLYAAVGDFDGALTAIDRALSLSPDSGVFLDRYGVILLWLGETVEAEKMFEAARAVGHMPYQPSQLVFQVRNQDRRKLQDSLVEHAKGQRIEEVSWIEAFLNGIWDESQRDAAKLAVAEAVANRDLRGQYIYAAWIYLGDVDRAFDALERLLETNPLEVSVEYLFADETRPLRLDDRFRDIVELLNLDDFWLAESEDSLCPALFEEPLERDWCADLSAR